MKLYGLIGYPLAHSYSKRYFTEKFRNENITDCEYRLFPMENLNSFHHLIHDYPELSGINVTLPYKKEIMNLVDFIDPKAREIGSVNAIRIVRRNDNVILEGFNTDARGFERAFFPLATSFGKNALILGSGGSSSAIKYVLRQHSWKFLIVSRSKEKGHLIYEELNENILNHYKVIINTTPLGMFPDIHSHPELPYELLNPSFFLFDLIYNPPETMFLRKGREQGAYTENGLKMLHYQAEEAWSIWHSAT